MVSRINRSGMMDSSLSRRGFLGLGAAAASTLLLPKSATAGLLIPRKLLEHERKLNLYNVHTGESFHQCYWANGRYLPSAMRAINRLFRDHRTQEVKVIRPDLIDLLSRLQREMNYSKAFEMVSGYRSAKTNAMLRRSSRGVARRSLHMEGAAVDLRFRGSSLRYAHKAVCSFRAGGVGYYPGRFIHMDVRGSVVRWVG